VRYLLLFPDPDEEGDMCSHEQPCDRLQALGLRTKKPKRVDKDELRELRCERVFPSV
jgi:hypothetical protein